MRALVVTNMYPTAGDPARGRFVADQVRCLAQLPGVEVEVFAFGHGGARPYLEAARELRRRYGGQSFDVIHAHFGLTAWPSLALRGAPHIVTLHGTDLSHPRSRAITLAALPLVDRVAPVSDALAELLPSWLSPAKRVVLPCGVDTERFKPIPRELARRELGLAQDARYLLFAADPSRPEKRFDRAAALAGDAQLLTLGRVDPAEVPLWVNSADAVLVTSERESFGLAVLEALACDVPVLATPVGIAPQVIPEVQGAYCAPFEQAAWSDALGEVLSRSDPRVGGRQTATRYSARRMAERVLETWRRLSG